MAYSAASDLLIGDLRLGPSLSKDAFVAEAADEMNAKLGYQYELPLRPVGFEGTPDATSWTGLPQHEQLLLKGINNRLASGRLIMATAASGEEMSVHAYGASLVRDALNDLYCIANGDVDLTAVVAAGKIEAETGPKVVNADDESLLLGFENTVLRSVPWRTRPGAIP